MRTVCIHQPDFAPWLGFFQRVLGCDLFVVLDDVQYVRRGWHNRDKIKTPDGVRWLSVPVQNKGRSGMLIRDAKLDESQEWKRKHLRTLEHSYGKSPHYDRYIEIVRSAYDRGHTFLIDFNMEIIGGLLDVFRIRTPVVMASTLEAGGQKSERLIEIARGVGADTYLSGLGAAEYLDENAFATAGIKVVWQKFRHPVYPQMNGEFVAELSSLDCIFNCGPKAAGLLSGTG